MAEGEPGPSGDRQRPGIFDQFRRFEDENDSGKSDFVLSDDGSE